MDNEEIEIILVRYKFSSDRNAAKKEVKSLIIRELIDELGSVLGNVPMPKLSYEQVENRINELHSELEKQKEKN